MFSSIVSDYNHLRTTGNISVGIHPIPSHIRKGVLIRRIIGSHLCTLVQQLVTSNFAKN